MPQADPHVPTPPARLVAVDNLRSCLTLLVVAHHAALAYVSFAPPPVTPWSDPPLTWLAFPVVDAARSSLLDLLVGFNDAFLMSLFFLIAGLFTWQGLVTRGSVGYVTARARRLGLPFLFAVVVVAPVAYYPAYLERPGAGGVRDYLGAWLALDTWPSGPAWFLWVLLAFSALAAVGRRVAPGWGAALGRILGRRGARPARLFAGLLASSAAAYLAMTAVVNPSSWFAWGPFAAQTSRLPHYALYFVIGVGLGVGPIRRLLAPDGGLARRWSLLTAAAGVAFAALVVGVVAYFARLQAGTPASGLRLAVNVGFALSCAASAFMFLSLAARFGASRGPIWRSLSRNALGIYVLHYAFSSWTQLLLLEAPLSGAVKATLVFVVAVLLSWGTTGAYRAARSFLATPTQTVLRGAEIG